MDYKKLEYNNYTLHIINTQRFKTLNVEVFFSNTYNRKSKVYYTFLSSLLSNTCKKYNTKAKMNIKKEELYDLSLMYSYFTIGKCQVFSCDLTVVNPKYIDNKLYDEVFSFLGETMFNPNIVDNKFDEKEFAFSTDAIINGIKRGKENNSSYAVKEFNKIFYDKTPLKYPFYEKEDVYKKVKNEEVYDFYKNIFTDNKIDIFILGDIDEKLIIKKIEKIFKNVKGNKNLKLDLYIDNKIKEKSVIIKETKDFKQSVILVGYKFKNLTDYELKYVLPIYNLMLGGCSVSNSILFTNVREKNSLCYSIASYAYKYSSSLVVESQINKSNYDKTLKIIKKSIKIDKNVENLNDLFVSSKKSTNIGFNDYYDNPYKIIERYFICTFENMLDIESVRKITNEINISDVFELSRKLKLDTIYFLEGDKNERE